MDEHTNVSTGRRKYIVIGILLELWCVNQGIAVSNLEYEDGSEWHTNPVVLSEADGDIPGTVVFRLDSETNNDNIYRLDGDSPWVVVGTDGVVSVKQKWDYESLDPATKEIVLQLLVTNRHTNATGTQRVVIKMTDVNDESPSFTNRPLPLQTVVDQYAPMGTVLYTLTATDPDNDHDIRYYIDRDRTGGLFEVDELTGEVRTTRNNTYFLDTEYVIFVKAVDQKGSFEQSTPIERLSTVGITRRPQFYQPQYDIIVPEDTEKHSEILSVGAKSFSADTVEYTLREKTERTYIFNIDKSSGIITMDKDLDFEDADQPNIFELAVFALDNGNRLTSSVDLTITVEDSNDNAPVFENAIYQTYDIDEDIAIGSSLLTVFAQDEDSGLNGEFTYSVDNDHFTVTDEGVVQVSKVLDADGNKGMYEFSVTAKDRGDSPKEGTATVYIYTNNKNDESPIFAQQVYTPNTNENAYINTHVTTVSASDKDGDGIVYGFEGGASNYGQFVINNISGEIRLHNGPILLDKEMYEINITATDDGSCCSRGSSIRHTSTAVVVVFITDVNDNRPIFQLCSTYNPSMEESMPVGSAVFTVHADDEDKGANGGITYSIVEQPNKNEPMFTINSGTGVVATKKIFDREGVDGKFVMLTVRATDRGNPSLEGLCSFRINITDVNDNRPLFGRLAYTEIVEPDTAVGSILFRMAALDKDAGDNATIVYGISPTTDQGYFEIDAHTGYVKLKKKLDRKSFEFAVSAMDPVITSLASEAFVQVLVQRPNMRDSYFGPKFRQSLYEVTVGEYEDLHRTIVSVSAEGKRKDPRVTYKLRSVTGAAFDVEPNTGDIYVAKSIKDQRWKRYAFTAVATDVDGKIGTVSVVVYVKDALDEAPHFEKKFYEITVKEEEDRGLPNKLITLIAPIGDRGDSRYTRYFLSGQGVDYEDPANSVFEVNQYGGAIYIRKPLDRDEPNGQREWHFTILAQHHSGAGFMDFAYIKVNLEDINDNRPMFRDIVYFGNIAENGTSGREVMVVTADDRDSPLVSQNSRLTYNIEKNAIDEHTGDVLFQIEPETGLIKTYGCCLDRESMSQYSLTVVAQDGHGLTGTATASIILTDINDSPPKFTQDEWVVEVDETMGTILPVHEILVVTVDDADETNDLYYKVIADSGFGSDKFTIIRSEDGSGSLKIIKPIDYEDQIQRNGFRFNIQVSDVMGNLDDMSDHISYSSVNIKVRDINDNAPTMYNSNIEIGISEDVNIGHILGTFNASDLDQNGLGKIAYAIDLSTDKNKQFAIDSHGTVRIHRSLDRETDPQHLVHILAIDDGIPARTGTGTLLINVIDVNDNGPKLREDYEAVLMEHESPKHNIIEIFATDEDDGLKGYGSPFKFEMSQNVFDEIRSSFKVQHNPTAADGDGSAVISSLRTFDRESQEKYHIPVVIKDSGNPQMTSTEIVTIVIGDLNDNKMYPGSKDILVYNFVDDHSNARAEIQIGRVFVDDYDDWDLPDKTFNWSDHTNNKFILNNNDGMISMKRDILEGQYFLSFNVNDMKHRQTDILANVTVRVRNISNIDILNSGSVRIANITDEMFLSKWNDDFSVVKSKYEIFREQISHIVGIPLDAVNVFSVQQSQHKPPIIDVRFGIFDTDNNDPVKLNGLLLLHQSDIELAAGINIIMIGINECLNEVVCMGSCVSNSVILPNSYLVDANKTSLVSVRIETTTECTCGARNFKQEGTCNPNPCLNNGRCLSTRTGSQCHCDNGFEGPRCQMTTRSFQGNGYAWFPTLVTCENSHISLEFMTVHLQGLLLYNGPIASITEGVVDRADFIAIELVNGKPRLLIDFGSGGLELEVSTKANITDGKWHRIDVYWDNQNVRIDVDNCQEAQISEFDGEGEPFFDGSTCTANATVPNFDDYLTVTGPLQVGGIYNPLNYTVQDRSFSLEGRPYTGCIRNIIVDSKLLDLASPGISNSSQNGCLIVEEACRKMSESKKCGTGGICDVSVNQPVCKCKPGYTGQSCNEKTTPTFFENNSYVKYEQRTLNNDFKTEIQLRFRTWEENGELVQLNSGLYLEYSILEIKNRNLRFRYNYNNFEPNERVLSLSNVFVNDGLWHLARLERHGSVIGLRLDGGEGRRYNETTAMSGHLLMNVDLRGVFIGGKPEYHDLSSFDVTNDFYKGCLDDIRLNGKPLPLPPANTATPAFETISSKNVKERCDSRDTCADVTCPGPYTCQPLWMRYECV